jgi:2-dehydro-3-deoxy-D-arabinonate dehydratase
MRLTKHRLQEGPNWALDGHLLPRGVDLGLLLSLPRRAMLDLLQCLPPGERTEAAVVAPIDPGQEVWAAGVTYRRSREAREAESRSANVYERVYEAPRPELFFKAVGWRVVGDGEPLRIRRDSRWNVPEPELAVLANCQGEIVGLSAGNDMSSRDIEGENPLYLPQAKIYDGSCGLGPGIELATPDEMRDLPVTLRIQRGGEVAFQGETSTSQMKRGLQELVDYLFHELAFPRGVWLMTGTGLVPPDEFTLEVSDRVQIQVGALCLENPVLT